MALPSALSMEIPRAVTIAALISETAVRHPVRPRGRVCTAVDVAQACNRLGLVPIPLEAATAGRVDRELLAGLLEELTAHGVAVTERPARLRDLLDMERIELQRTGTTSGLG